MKEAAELLLKYAVRYLAEEDGHDDEDHDHHEEFEEEELHHDDFDHDYNGSSHDFSLEEVLFATSANNATDTTSTDGKPWGAVIAASFLINLVTFSGLFVAVFCVVIPRRVHEYRKAKKQREREQQQHNCHDHGCDHQLAAEVASTTSTASSATTFLFSYRLDNLILPSFAAGALLAAVVFLIVPEAILLLEGVHEEDDHGSSQEMDSHEGHDHRRALLGKLAVGAGKWWMQQNGRALQDDHDEHEHEEHEEEEEHHDEEEVHYDEMDHAWTNLSSAFSETMEEDLHAHEGEDNHGSVAWKFGVAVLAGYLLPLLLSSIFPPPHVPEDPNCETCRARAEEESRLALEREREQDDEGTLLLLPLEYDDDTEDPKHNHSMSRNRARRSASNEIMVSQIVDVDEMIAAASAARDSTNSSSDEIKCTTTPMGHDSVAVPAEVDAFRVSFSESGERNKGNTEDSAGAEQTHPETTTGSVRHSLLASVQSQGSGSGDKNQKTAVQVDKSLVLSILLGDALHNFTDGIFIGNAFLFCNRQVAYTIVAATVYHEFAQEVADFTILTQHCHLTTLHALVLNFFSGFSVMIGALLILSIDLSEESMGAVLAVSAGVYIYIAASEIIPRIYGNPSNQDAKSRALFFLCFACGAVPIGLVLLNHSHSC